MPSSLVPPSLVPPRAPRRPHRLVAHDDERTDDWYWLRDRDDPEVIAYLEAENRYLDEALRHVAARREDLYHEIVGRVQETDVSAPIPEGDWEYFTRTFEGRQYGAHGRRPRGAPESEAETTLLDENALAEGHDFFALGGFALSPRQELLAYSSDHTGGERYELRFRDLVTGDELPDVIPDVYYGLGWADEATVFYVKPDDAVRPYQVWRHRLGLPVTDDVLVYEEHDERYFVSVGRTRSGRYLVITSESKMTSEARVVPTADPTADPMLVAPREEGVEYGIEHHTSADHGDRFFILTNADGAENFKLMVTSVGSAARSEWTEVVPHRTDVKLDDVDAFARHLVLSERTGGLERLNVLDLEDDARSHTIEMPDPVFSVWVDANLEYDTDTLRYGYTSLVAPTSAFDYDLTKRSTSLVKQQPVLGGYEPSSFTSARLWATAPDGVRIPISVVHRRDVPLDGSAPCVLYGYGAYEISIDPGFSSARLSLLERGVVYAIAHVRGGGELGRTWYEDGRLANKPNTFGDFVACAEHLVAQRYTSPARLAARGGSAGGLLMGAVANLRPDLFRAIVAEVPFVDCLTTILDDTLPLTVTEWEEWGNPVEDPATYALMKSYAPYDNVRAHAYPALFVTAGLNDPRVSYWEPAKWVAKLRVLKQGDSLLVLKTEMGAGHGGPSGRYDAWRDEALVFAFLLDQLGA